MNHYERRKALKRRRNSIARKLLFTLAIFSWPGLIVAQIGNQNGNLGLVIGGLLVTGIVWSAYVVPLYKDWIQAKKTVGRRQTLKPAHTRLTAESRRMRSS